MDYLEKLLIPARTDIRKWSTVTLEEFMTRAERGTNGTSHEHFPNAPAGGPYLAVCVAGLEQTRRAIDGLHLRLIETQMNWKTTTLIDLLVENLKGDAHLTVKSPGDLTLAKSGLVMLATSPEAVASLEEWFRLT